MGIINTSARATKHKNLMLTPVSTSLLQRCKLRFEKQRSYNGVKR